jgi:hypothetical protein
MRPVRHGPARRDGRYNRAACCPLVMARLVHGMYTSRKRSVAAVPPTVMARTSRIGAHSAGWRPSRCNDIMPAQLVPDEGRQGQICGDKAPAEGGPRSVLVAVRATRRQCWLHRWQSSGHGVCHGVSPSFSGGRHLIGSLAVSGDFRRCARSATLPFSVQLRCAPKGAITLWVEVPPGQWSVGPVAGRRCGWATGRIEALRQRPPRAVERLDGP